MAIVSIQSIQQKSRFTFFAFLLVLLLIPCQKPMKGLFAKVAHLLTPLDPSLPVYFSKELPIYCSDFALLLFIALLLFHLRPSWSRFFWEGPSKYLTLLFVTSIVSILLSKTALYPIQYAKLLKFSLYFCLFHALRLGIPFLGRESLIRGVALLLVFVSILESGLALLQYFLQTELGLSSLGEHALSHFPFANNTIACQLGASHISTTLFRASGTFSHPNILGCLLFCGLLSTLYLVQKERRILDRWLLGVCLLLQMTALYVSFSRSALLGVGLAIPVFYLVLTISGAISKQSIVKKVGAMALFAALITVALFPALKARGGIVNYSGPAPGADRERLYYCQIAIDMIKEHPLFGVGYNNFQLYSQATYPEKPGHYFHSKVHNIFLLTAAETGLIGFSFLFFFLLHTLLPICRQVRVDQFREERAYLLALMSGLLWVGCVDFFLFYVGVGSILFFLVAGLMYGLGKQAKGQDARNL